MGERERLPLLLFKDMGERGDVLYNDMLENGFRTVPCCCFAIGPYLGINASQEQKTQISTHSVRSTVHYQSHLADMMFDGLSLSRGCQYGAHCNGTV